MVHVVATIRGDAAHVRPILETTLGDLRSPSRAEPEPGEADGA